VPKLEVSTGCGGPRRGSASTETRRLHSSDPKRLFREAQDTITARSNAMADVSKDAAQALAEAMARGQARLSQLGFTWPDDVNATRNLTETFQRYAEVQKDFVDQFSRFWTSMAGSAGGGEGSSSAPADKRLSGEAWEKSPWAEAMKRAYLTYCSALEESVDSTALDERAGAQVRFGLRQFLDAMSPANFLMTNPEALELARKTNGRSLAEGMQLYFQDLAKGQISTTDESAFEVGRNLAVTPGAVVFENELMQLIQYAPLTDEIASRPLLVIPPCINKYYILDLQPENSFVRYALERGNGVFMVSWRSATAEMAALTWDDYLQKGVMQAIDVTLDLSGADRVNALGFCVGGTLLVCALAIMTERSESKVASLTLLTTMLDFSDAGELGKLISDQALLAKETSIGKLGILQGKELEFAFSSLRANDLMWQYVTNSYLKGTAPPAFDMLYWNSDSANLPGPMFCWYVRNAYLENNLRHAGRTVQCGVPVDLSRVHAPAFLYASRDDHIVPWKSAFASRDILSGDSVFILGASGHIAGVINHPAKNKRNYWADGASDVDAQHWLETAQSTPGSWWPRWAAWLAQYSGPGKPRAKRLGNERYPVIEPAPGRYVMQKG
jgi:polyhydroxyalkanoate synthase